MGKLVSPSMERQEWMEKASQSLRALFRSKGHQVPGEVRVSIGWPKGSHGGKKAIGQCWATEASADKHHEIFISPELGHNGKVKAGEMASVRIITTMAHEFCHAVAGNKAGHRRPFQLVAGAIGFMGPWTTTPEGPELIAWSRQCIKIIGPFPAGALSALERKKQGTRLLKCECSECGYLVRITRKWIETAGPPICPTDRASLVCEAIEDEEGEDG